MTLAEFTERYPEEVARQKARAAYIDPWEDFLIIPFYTSRINKCMENEDYTRAQEYQTFFNKELENLAQEMEIKNRYFEYRREHPRENIQLAFWGHLPQHANDCCYQPKTKNN